MKTQLPSGYSTPTALPSDALHPDWQARNRDWWEAHPMRYDWNGALPAREFSADFYRAIDQRFFDDAAHYLPPRTRPFDRLIPFERLAECDVLEVGVGSGSHAHLLAPHCRSYTGIDLTRYAVISTAKRLQLFGLAGTIVRMDAEQMAFPGESFDFVWTWGVIHHSADTARALREIHRVLRPGGQAVVMVYHRSWLYTYVYAALLHGVLRGGLLRHSLHELLQLNTDGAIARFYRPREWRSLVARVGFEIVEEQVLGQKSEVLLLPPGRGKDLLMKALPDSVSRFITNRCRQGSFLVSTLRKPARG